MLPSSQRWSVSILLQLTCSDMGRCLSRHMGLVIFPAGTSLESLWPFTIEQTIGHATFWIQISIQLTFLREKGHSALFWESAANLNIGSGLHGSIILRLWQVWFFFDKSNIRQFYETCFFVLFVFLCKKKLNLVYNYFLWHFSDVTCISRYYYFIDTQYIQTTV